MPELTLVIPGLLSPPPALAAGATGVPAAPGTASLLARAERHYHGFTTLLEVLAVHAEAPELAVGAGPASWVAEGGEALAGDTFCMRADPLTLVPDRDRLRVQWHAGATLVPEDADALVASLNAHFAADGVAFRRGRGGAWYLFTGEPLDVRCTPLDALQRTDLRDAQPRGHDAARVSGWMNEAQMLLHTHPVNAAREARGEPPVNGVWLWGPGRLPAPAMSAYDTVFADDPLPHALGARHESLPGGMRTVSVNGSGGRVLVVCAPLPWPDPVACKDAIEAAESAWFVPLREQLGAGRWRTAVVDGCDGRAFRCDRLQRFTRFWRRRALERLFV